MRKPCLFGMITTRASARYTTPALASLLTHTELIADDRVILLDNDGDFPGIPNPRVELVRNIEPQSFARNANKLIDMAADRTLLLLNNDLIFTPGWLPPLLASNKISSPFSNGQLCYQTPDLALKDSMELKDLVGKEPALNLIAREHAKRVTTAIPLMILPFFCVAIPSPIFSKVGPFDEAFQPAGGEDFDYCLRAHLAGFSVEYAPHSFVLHFGGGSTWAGPESEAKYRDRAERFIGVFF